MSGLTWAHGEIHAVAYVQPKRCPCPFHRFLCRDLASLGADPASRRLLKRQQAAGARSARWITPRSLRCQHSFRLGSRSQRCARARSDMIWALSAVSLVRFCSWALSSAPGSSVTQPATNTASPAIRQRRVIVRWLCEKGNCRILFSCRRLVCLIAAAVRIAAVLRRRVGCRRRLREHGFVAQIP